MRAAHLAVGGLGAVGQVLVHGAHDRERAAVEQAGLAQLMHDHRHAADSVQVDERARAGRLQLHQVRGARACRIPIVHGDGMARLLGDGGEVQHRVRGTAEGHIAFHGVMDGGLRDDVLDADALLQKLHDLHAGMLGKTQALGVHGGDGAVAGKRDAQSLAQAVHGVGSEHAGAGSAGGARGVLEVLELLFGHGAGGNLAGAVEKRVQVGGDALRAPGLMAGEHGAAGDEHRGDVHAQRAEQHAGDDLVAVGDAHGRIEGMALDGALEAVGDGFARHERVMHAVVVHGDAVAHADGGDLEGHAASHVDAGLHGFADLIEVVVTGDDVVAGVEHRDKRALQLLVGQAVGLEQAAVRGARNAASDGVAAKLHANPSSFFCPFEA